MNELDVIWCHEQESIEELKQKLLYTILQLESLNEQMRIHKEDIQNLINLIRIAYTERDEAKNQLRTLSEKLNAPNSAEIHQMSIHTVRGNSTVTESNTDSQSDTYIDTTATTEFSSINSINAFVRDPNSLNAMLPPTLIKNDPADAEIDNLVKGKVLPQKGKLLQAVTEAGPLLQTLLVAGPLPRWKNPPPLQPFSVPPITIKGCDSVPQKPLNIARSHLKCSSSVTNFTNGGIGDGHSVSGFGVPWLMNAGAIYQTTATKRPRFQ